MDNTTCTTIVLLLVWLYLCCQALGSLVILLASYNSDVLYGTTTFSAILLAVCLWQCNNAGYLVSPMTRYHWVLLVLLVLLQVVAVVLAVLQQLDWGGSRVNYSHRWAYPIYGIAAVLLVVLGGTLFCGWKCNLFCRPCCKSQYICYGSAVVAALVILILLALTASLIRFLGGDYGYSDDVRGKTEKTVMNYLDRMAVPITRIYATAVVWNTTVTLPYKVPEVVALVGASLATASILAVAVLSSTLGHDNSTEYALLSVHLVVLAITWYFLQYKATFFWPKDYMCFGLLAVVLVASLVVVIVIAIKIASSYHDDNEQNSLKYTLVGYSVLLMIPTLWYAYRCGLFTWCLPKKKGLKATDTADNTIPDTDIATE